MERHSPAGKARPGSIVIENARGDNLKPSTNMQAIKPLKKRPLFRDDICEYMKDSILTGKLKPGDRIVETQWARDLGVSQSPVREAIRSLESIGLVYTVPFQGTYVSSITLQDLIDAHTIRSNLETLGVRYAVPLITDEQLEKMYEIIREMEQAGKRGDFKQYVYLDSSFHRMIIRIANKAMLLRLWDQCNIQEWTYYGTRFSSLNMEQLAKRHESIYSALAARDEEQAVKQVVLHLQELIDDMQRRVGTDEQLQ